MKYTDSEMQIMELFWSATAPLSAQDILALSPEDKKQSIIKIKKG